MSHYKISEGAQWIQLDKTQHNDLKYHKNVK